MTNKEYFQTCSKEELAQSLTEMIVTVIEEITQKTVSDSLRLLEYKSLIKFLDSEFLEPSKYIN